MKRLVTISLSACLLFACAEKEPKTPEESADIVEDTGPPPPALCDTDNECPKGDYCKVGLGASKPGEASKLGTCTPMVSHGIVDGKPPNPGGGGGSGNKFCNGNFTLGETQFWGPALLGQACNPKNHPKNCADGTWLNFPASNKCYCIAQCATLGKKPGEWCEDSFTFICLPVLSSNAAADKGSVCVKYEWKLCTDGSEGEVEPPPDTGGGTDGADGTDKGDGVDGVDGKDKSDATDAADGKDSSDATDGTDASDNGDGTDGSDNSDGTDASDGTDGETG